MDIVANLVHLNVSSFQKISIDAFNYESNELGCRDQMFIIIIIFDIIVTLQNMTSADFVTVDNFLSNGFVLIGAMAIFGVVQFLCDQYHTYMCVIVSVHIRSAAQVRIFLFIFFYIFYLCFWMEKEKSFNSSEALLA